LKNSLINAYAKPTIIPKISPTKTIKILFGFIGFSKSKASSKTLAFEMVEDFKMAVSDLFSSKNE
jgi:hypothetical protein